MTAKGLVPAPPDRKWRLCDSAVGGYDFSLRLWHTWDHPSDEGLCYGPNGYVSALAGALVPREADLHRVSKRLVREYYREQAREARVDRVLEEYK